MNILEIMAIGFFTVMLLAFAFPDRDDTDSPTERSRMSLHTDHKTGCQYLSVIFGGMTPRVDSSGKHICVKEK